jgi:hypothetical protein
MKCLPCLAAEVSYSAYGLRYDCWTALSVEVYGFSPITYPKRFASNFQNLHYVCTSKTSDLQYLVKESIQIHSSIRIHSKLLFLQMINGKKLKAVFLFFVFMFVIVFMLIFVFVLYLSFIFDSTCFNKECRPLWYSFHIVSGQYLPNITLMSTDINSSCFLLLSELPSNAKDPSFLILDCWSFIP